MHSVLYFYSLKGISLAAKNPSDNHLGSLAKWIIFAAIISLKDCNLVINVFRLKVRAYES